MQSETRLSDRILALGSFEEKDLRELALSWNRLAQPGPIAVLGTYLESVGGRS